MRSQTLRQFMEQHQEEIDAYIRRADTSLQLVPITTQIRGEWVLHDEFLSAWAKREGVRGDERL